MRKDETEKVLVFLHPDVRNRYTRTLGMWTREHAHCNGPPGSDKHVYITEKARSSCSNGTKKPYSQCVAVDYCYIRLH